MLKRMVLRWDIEVSGDFYYSDGSLYTLSKKDCLYRNVLWILKCKAWVTRS
jgi:hypothetical protein